VYYKLKQFSLHRDDTHQREKSATSQNPVRGPFWMMC
jgi:hypothetical protein